MSTFIEKKVTPIKCHRCLHKWNYSGTNSYVATCPHCRTYVNIKKNKKNYKERIGKEQIINIKKNEKKSDSFESVNSNRESNESFSQ